MGFIGSALKSNGTPIEAAGSDGPIMVITVDKLRECVERFIKGFPGQTTYALKANAHPGIIEAFGKSGITTFDVASIREMQDVRQVLPDAKLHYHNPVRSREEIAAAYFEFGCRRFSIDHRAELSKIHSIVSEPTDIEIAVRFKRDQVSEAVQAFDSKFGASEEQAVELLKVAKSHGFAVGLTFHPGSQTPNSKPYADHCHSAASIGHKAGITPEFINVGGGFPGAYTGLQCAPLEDFFSGIDRACHSAFEGHPPRLECEPGRALVSPSGRLLTTVKAVRRDKGELFLNDGIYGGLLEVSQFPSMQPAYGLDRNSAAGVTSKRWTAFGPTCDPIDVLPFKLDLPCDVAEGDVVWFDGVGAYSTATATRFNGYGSVQTLFV